MRDSVASIAPVDDTDSDCGSVADLAKRIQSEVKGDSSGELRVRTIKSRARAQSMYALVCVVLCGGADGV